MQNLTLIDRSYMELSRPLLIAVFGLVAATQAASLIGIGHLPDGTRSEARAISADGSTVVGMATDSEFTDGQAIRWTRAEGMAPLGDLPGGGKKSIASAVSSDGKVIVGLGTSANTAAGPEAFIWTDPEGMRRLAPILPSSTINSGADAVSADGEVVTGSINHPLGEAFRWTRAEGLVLLGDLPGGQFQSGAIGASASGTVIVGQGHSADGVEAFRWTSETGMVGLGHLSGSAFAQSTAMAVSADGSVVVGFGSTTYAFEAFRWTAATGMKGLGFLSDGTPGSHAFAVSADGRVIGGSAGTERGEVAFVWTEARGMQKLWDLLLSQGVNPAAHGWGNLESVRGLSADGRHVVGVGKRNGRDEGFVAEIGAQLSYAQVDGGIELTWPAGFRLERTLVLDGGSWQALLSNSPLRVNFAAGKEFFRLVAEP